MLTEELERKFILKDISVLKNKPCYRIEQVYFSKIQFFEKMIKDLTVYESQGLLEEILKDQNNASSLRIRKIIRDKDVTFLYTCKTFDEKTGSLYEKELEILPKNKANVFFEALKENLHLRNRLFEVIASLITTFPTDGILGFVAKDRYEILYKGAKFEIDAYKGPLIGLYTVEVEAPSNLSSADKKSFIENVKLPPWVGQEITQNKLFSNKALSKKSVIL